MKHFPQAVTERPGKNAIFIVYGLKESPDTIPQVKDVCANFAGLIRSMQHRFPDAQFSATISFGADAWKKLFPDQHVPKQLNPFKAIHGAKHTAVSTPGDLLFHIRGAEMGLCYEFAAIIDEKLSGVVGPIDETYCFRYMDGKSIIGFVDGTENPAVDDDPYHFAVIGEEDLEFAGRRKFNDVELSDQEKPDNAHNAVANIGDDLKIVRANMPFANTSKGEYGTYFIGYAGKFSTTHKMLENMFAGDKAGNSDRLLDFSTPITGTLFFAPSLDLLGELGE